MTNPYDAKIIPKDDIYSDVPLYGRFESTTDDFDPTNKTPQEILKLCGPENEMLSVIVKGDDHSPGTLQSHEYGDANEVAAIALVSQHFPEIPVPEIIFQGKIDGIDYLIQCRIEGVALNVAWPYLTSTQKSSFKKEARKIVHKLRTLKGPHQYVVPDPNPQVNKNLTSDEVSRLLGHNPPEESYFAHNDLQPSNIIVHNDRIVGVIDWEMAGFFGERAADVHRNLRTPSLESLSQTGLSDEKKAELTFWGDIYDEA